MSDKVASENKRRKMLEGMVVLDLTRVLAGPYCGMMLADMGATVYKIERPGTGDDSRAFGPHVNGESAYYMNFNRGKYGCTLNLKSEEGRKVFLEMVKKADVVIENYRPGTMEKLGLGYEKLREVNPKIIYGSASGFGHYGPYSSKPGYDIIAQAMSGLMSTTGWPGGQATRTGAPMGDVLGGMCLTIGVLSAYVNRLKTGEGEKVDIALTDAAVSAMTNIIMIYLGGNRVPQRIGNRYESSYPYDTFPTKDDYVIIASANDKNNRLVCEVMGRPELADDPRFVTVADRVKNHAELKEIIDAWTVNYTTQEILDMMDEAGVPAAPIYTVDQVTEDEHIAGARNMFPELEHPVAGAMRHINNPFKFLEHDSDPERPAPTLGQHNDLVYGEFLGLSEDEIRRLAEEKVI